MGSCPAGALTPSVVPQPGFPLVNASGVESVTHCKLADLLFSRIAEPGITRATEAENPPPHREKESGMDTIRASDRVELASAVIADRLDLDPEIAAELLWGVAQRTGVSPDELAADVLASSFSSEVTISTNDHDYEPAA